MNIHLIGDPHLGRRFVTGVPMHRRGDREAMVLEDFRSQVQDTVCDLNIMMGDIFDKFVVPIEIVIEAAVIYEMAAKANPLREFVLLRGNHDASRDADRKSSFDILAMLLAPLPNVYVVRNEPIVVANRAFFPWHPFVSAQELVGQLAAKNNGRVYDAAYGHWDVVDFSGENPNMIPAKALKIITGLAVTGHDHAARELKIDGLDVIVTGSMQPYSHGEDADATMYVTITAEDLLKLPASETAGRCYRVLLEPGEELPMGIDCLSIVPKRIREETDEEVEVDLSDFDFKAMFIAALVQFGVSPGLTKKLWSDYEELKNA